MTQEPMHSTVPGNPSTTLSTTYVAGTDTQINVVDGTQLPDAPNRVTLWSMDKTKLVTVEYLSKTGNILSDLTVEEGFPANAVTKTFPAGSMAHRPLCSADMMAIIANILDLYAGKADLSHAERHEAGGADELELNASQIKDGIIDIARIPKAATERISTVANDTARFALTADDVQLGDSVKVTATDRMYVVVDVSKLNSEAGYMIYTAKPLPHSSTHLTGEDDAIAKASTSRDGLMSKEDKSKLDQIEKKADVSPIRSVSVDNVAVSPDSAKNININLSGKADVKHASRHLTNGGDAIPKATSSADGLMPATDKKKLDELSNATQSKAGLMSTDDKAKLDGIEEKAEVNHIDVVKVEGTALTPDADKAVNITKTDLDLDKVDNTLDKDKSVKSAGKLTTATTVEGMTFDGSAAISHYAVCSTAGSTAAKTAALDGFALKTGSRVIIGFANANTAQNPTLNVNSTGAKPIVWMGAPVSADLLKAGAVYEMVYDGTNYAIVGDLTRLKTPEVHGILIDDTNSDPKTRVTIVGKSANWTGEEREVEFVKHVRHCVMKAAKTLFYCDESDWSKKEDGTDSGVANGFDLDGNFMLEHKTFWFRVTQYGEKVGLIEFTWDNPHDPNWYTPHAYADGSVREIVYTGVEEGTNSASYNGTTNCLRSVHGDTDGTDDTVSYLPLVNINNEVAYQRARNTGLAEGLTVEENTYATQQPLVTIMRQILKVWRYKTTDIQTNVARGICNGVWADGRRPCGYGISLTGGNTQGKPGSTGTRADEVGACTCGAVNEHGNTWEHQGDMIYNGWGELAVAVQGGDHLNITTVTTNEAYAEQVPETYKRIKGVCTTSGYVKEMTFDPAYPFAPKAVGGGTTTYYADYTYRNADATEENHTPRCCLLGGHWSYGSVAGAFSLYLYHAVGNAHSDIGCRLQAHSLT